MTFFWSRPERVENVIVKLTMDSAAYHRLKDDIRTMGIELSVGPNDTVNIEHEFTVEYYNIVDTLKTLIVLLNDPSVSAAMIGSPDDLNLLFVDLVDTIRSVQKTLAEKISQ